MSNSARRIVVRVPASSANLGPGFDVLAMALGLHMTLEVVETGHFALETDLHLRRDRNNLIVRAFERLHPADRYAFRVSSTIPLVGGLGSSAAGVVGGLLAADHLFGLGADVFALGTELEGHPDNVGAALYGGVVACAGATARRIEPPADLAALLVVPEVSVHTPQARAALPESVPLTDAVANLGAISELILGLATGDLNLIAAGLRDRLHQPYRSHLYPRSAAIIERAPALGALGATISGAGPTVLVWVAAGAAPSVIDALAAEADGWARVIPVELERNGAQVDG